MLENPHITDAQSQFAAVIPLMIPRHEMPQQMGPAIEELMQELARQQIPPAGPMFSHHFRMDAETFDFVVGVPVASVVAGNGRVRPGELPAARVARAVHRGPYEELGSAWGEFEAWIASTGLPTRADFWERYLSGPESGAPPFTVANRTQPPAGIA